MKRRIRVTDDTADLMKGLHPEIKKKIKAGLEMILRSPEAGKSLKDEWKGLRSLKVGRFRVIYRLCSSDIIEIVAMGPRRIIYEVTYELIRKEEKG